MEIKTDVNPKDYHVGVLVARFQVNELHQAHKELIDFVCSNHKKVIIFLGVARVQNTKRNPLDFATRESMIKKEYPHVQILPLEDQRYNDVWSRVLDAAIRVPFGDLPAVLYGSRDSFIPYYGGKYKTIELQPSGDFNGTNIRSEVAREIKATPDFRAGVIHAAFAVGNRPVTYPTVDICVHNDKGQILLAKKPNEKLYRFVGGFVDREDEDYEMAAKRELKEETGGNLLVNNWRYIMSHKINDWRYQKEESGIMTTLFLASFGGGNFTPSDDIVHLEWVNINTFSNYDGVRTKVMPEHRELMTKLVKKIYAENLVPNLGPKLLEVEGITYTGE